MEQPRNVVGAKIRQLRDAKRISQQRLSVICSLVGYEITRSTLAKIESSIRAVSDIELFVMATALGVSMESLFPDNFAKSLRKGKIPPFHVRRDEQACPES